MSKIMTAKQFDILHHTVNLSAKMMYCGESKDPDLLRLAEMKFLKGPIRSAIIPNDHAYFKATKLGIKALEQTEPTNDQATEREDGN